LEIFNPAKAADASNDTLSKAPPVVSGALPWIGHLPQFMRNRDALMKRGFDEHGAVFSLRLPSPVAVVGGSQLNRWFFSETDRTLNISKPLEFLRAALGEVLLSAPKEVYDAQRPILKAVFSNERMRGYVQAMNVEVERWVASLGDRGELEISQAMLRLTQNVAGHALLGPRFREELGDEFWSAYGDVSLSIDPVLPPHWPFPKFLRRDKARETIRRIIHPAYERRRRDPAAYDDVLALLANTPILAGRTLDPDLAVLLVMGLMFAGHETTAGQAAWSVILPLQHEPVRHRLEQHVRALPAHDPLGAKELRSLDFAYRIVDETTRMRPSADILIRSVEEPVDIGGYQIPKGWRVMASGTVSHNIASQFKDPERFDPDRFSSDRGEGNDAWAIMGFGGGRHKCTGMTFAKNEIVVILAKLYGQFDLQLVSKDPVIVRGSGANRPSPTILRYQRRA
jgi:sterol 14alpha-demethylase